MKAIPTIVSVAFAAALGGGCTDRSTPTQGLINASVTSSTNTSVVFDAVGDIPVSSPGVNKQAPAWLDIVSASITRKDGRFILETELAAPFPTDPALDPDVPPQVDHIAVAYGLDTDPTAAPIGYPFSKNEANSQEFYLGVAWNPTGSLGLGTGVFGWLIDRRPLLTGGQATITAIPFNIQGNRISVVVDAAALGDPPTFRWAAFTELDKVAHPPDNFCCVDDAPDFFSGAPLATWPQ